MVQNKKVELLAPAGNMEGFLGAIHAGADAVYLGGSQFGARAYADNFTQEELLRAIRYAHLWNRKVYLTVNTLVKESEFSQLYEYMAPFYKAGLDGVIVQDIGVLQSLGRWFPQMELHASTQMTLAGSFGADYLKQLGVCRVVPARELSLKELRHLKEETGLELEVFIHGAMCYCYSGQCLFSSILGGRSGNRGRCAQPCRLPYQVNFQGKSGSECYPLSLKDMCTIEHLPSLIEAGIDSFKIEGRMKKPEYTAGVTSIYRKYIDQYYEGHWSGISKADLKKLSSLYIRSDRQDGYYQKHNGADMIALKNPAYQGTDEELLQDIRQQFLEKSPKMSIQMAARFQTGTAASLTICAGHHRLELIGMPVEKAAKQPISRDNIEKQLGKLGDSIFHMEQLELQLSEDVFYPLKAINDLRRKAVAGLEDLLLLENGFPIARTLPEDTQTVTSSGSADTSSQQTALPQAEVCSVRSISQLGGVLAFYRDYPPEKPLRIYINGDLLIDEKGIPKQEAGKLIASCQDFPYAAEYLIALPPVIRERDHQYLTGLYALVEEHPLFSGFLAKSLDGIGFLKQQGYGGMIYGDASLYLWNQESLSYWKQELTGFCLPLELRQAEQRELLGILPGEKILYGRSPMMITANCVVNTVYGCQKRSETQCAELIDRYRKTFPVELNCQHCMNIIYNSVPLSLHGTLPKWTTKVDSRWDFTVENGHETTEVLNFFHGVGKMPYQDYTTGHDKRGVE